MNKVQLTAMVMSDLLRDGMKVSAAELREELNGTRGHSRYITKAAKHLRDHGIPVVATKRRHKSQWWIAAAADEIPEFQDRLIREAYSEQVSLARSVAGMTGYLSRKVHETARKAAIDWGSYLGKDLETVMKECKPQPLVLEA